MADIAKLLEEIDSLTVVELADLVKAIEEKYGVSAVAAAAPAGGAVAGGEAAEEKAEWEAQRDALIERNNAAAKRNEFMTNVHSGTYSDDQIAAMLSALNNNEDTKGKSK